MFHLFVLLSLPVVPPLSDVLLSCTSREYRHYCMVFYPCTTVRILTSIAISTPPIYFCEIVLINLLSPLEGLLKAVGVRSQLDLLRAHRQVPMWAHTEIPPMYYSYSFGKFRLGGCGP